MGKYRKILVAVDSSESSRNALHQAFKLANEEKCWITVTSVVPPYEGEIETLGVKDIKAALRKPCDDALGEVEKIAKTERMLVKTVCEEGEVYERIVDLADAENCDVIVMGRRGLRRVERTLIGSVTARVIGHTQRDVLVVPNGTTVGWKTIVLATDGSKYSAAAAERAIAFAKSYGGELKVLSVVDVPTEFYAEAPQAVEDLVKKAKGFVADVKKQAEAAGVPAETFVMEAEAYQAVNNLAQEQKANMIVLGSHGRTGLRRLLMGSVTEAVIGHASCPVLVVKSS
ncbi:MAG TPA: universal stress protein [Nitrospirota bacterium]|nr:universal stress protein [Nitrospirota bacterium]